MRQVIVMSGISGSGKSTYIKEKLVRGKTFHTTDRFAEFVHHPHTVVVSTDDYFKVIGGGYCFDPSNIGNAHGMCFYSFIDALREQTPLVIVDNTNCTTYEISPYMLAAQAWGYEAEVTTIGVKTEDVAWVARRNLHQVPENVVWQQHHTQQDRDLPPWWKHTWI